MARRDRARGPRRRYQWIRETLVATEILNATSTGVLEITDAEIIAEGLAAPTLVRIRGNMLFYMDNVTATVGLAQRVGMGIIVTKSTVSAAEVGNPATDSNLDWMYWRADNLKVGSDLTAAGVEQPPGMVRYDFDVKAMRKIHKSSVHMIVYNVGDSAAHVFVGGSWSCLFQE